MGEPMRSEIKLYDENGHYYAMMSGSPDLRADGETPEAALRDLADAVEHARDGDDWTQ